MKLPVIQRLYPEHRLVGFSRYDGTVHFYSRVQALLEPGQTVLDVGCGRGGYQDDQSGYRRKLRILSGDERTVIGIDLDSAGQDNPYLDEFRMLQDADRWPLDDNSVDLVLADYVLEHVADPQSFFRELARVLKPGGYFCARTPNAWSYVGLMAQIIPNRFHARVTSAVQQGRKSIDVFPTVYACNSKRRLRRLLTANGFDASVYRIEAEPTYMAFSDIAYRIAALLHRILPPPLRSTLLIYARLGDGPGLATPSSGTTH